MTPARDAVDVRRVARRYFLSFGCLAFSPGQAFLALHGLGVTRPRVAPQLLAAAYNAIGFAVDQSAALEVAPGSSPIQGAP